jgi:hypothetical protein
MNTATRGLVITLLVLINAIAIRDGYTGQDIGYGVLLVSLPLLLVAIFYNTDHK